MREPLGPGRQHCVDHSLSLPQAGNEQGQTHCPVEDSRLPLDKHRILQQDRQRAEHQNQHPRDQRGRLRPVTAANQPLQGKLHDHGAHEHPHGGNHPPQDVGGEKRRQKEKIQGKLHGGGNDSPSASPFPQAAYNAPMLRFGQHPRGLATLFFTEMWERMSYYGMRALLVLFMVDQVQRGGMGLSDEIATAIYGVYTAAVYLVALPGGWMADRLLGGQRAVWVGGVIIMSGHFVLAIPSVAAFYLGLLLVVMGTGLLKPNISALVGQLYAPTDPRRDGGFTLYYLGINVGAFIGPLVCGKLADYNWHYGFAAAGVGMFFGLVQFHFTREYLGEAGARPEAALSPTWRRMAWLGVVACLATCAVVYAAALGGAIELNARAIAGASAWVILAVAAIYFILLLFYGGLTSRERLRMVGIIVLFFGAVMFWAGFEQSGSSLNLFAERYTIREFGGFRFPAEWFQSLNPFFIIVLGPLFAMLWTALARRNLDPSTPLKFAFGLIQLGLGFLVMIGAATLVARGNPVLPTWLFFTYLLHTTGELCLSPVGLSAVTRLAPRKYVGQMMGIWFLGASLGSLIAGLIAGEFDPEALGDMPGLYWQIVLTTVGSGLILAVCLKPLKKCMTPAEEVKK